MRMSIENIMYNIKGEKKMKVKIKLSRERKRKTLILIREISTSKTSKKKKENLRKFLLKNIFLSFFPLHP